MASRSLAMIFGSSLQSFAVVLMAFILGIGLGGAWIASARQGKFSDEKLVILLLCAAAAWVTLLVFNLEHWTDFYRIAQTGLGQTARFSALALEQNPADPQAPFLFRIIARPCGVKTRRGVAATLAATQLNRSGLAAQPTGPRLKSRFDESRPLR